MRRVGRNINTGLAVELGGSLTTTNSIENVNSKLARWIATELIEVESRLRRIDNYKKLHLLRNALKTELRLNRTKVA